jgi:hypothetical protein
MIETSETRGVVFAFTAWALLAIGSAAATWWWTRPRR